MAGDAYHVENFGLDPEKSENYEIGLDYYKGAFDSSLTFFYSDVEDRIVAEEIAPWKYQYKNIDEATVSGLEGQVSYDVGALFDCPWEIKPYINFTYLTELEDEEAEDDLFYVSDMNVSYGISIADNNGFATRLNLSYVGDQDIQVYDPEPTRIKKGGFTVADLTIQKRVLDFNSYGDLSLRGEVRNLFDKDYSYVKGYPMPGRSFVLGMEYSF
jgi:vitamin B12 transporter